ncbi:MAG: DUF998 domain-containing protein [Stackebrandtia sp.]
MTALKPAAAETTTPQPSSSAVAAPPAWAGNLSFAGIVLSLITFALLHVLMAGIANPMIQPLSDYALDPPGSVLFAIGVLLMAGACTVLTFGGMGLPNEKPVRLLLGVVTILLVLTATFPTDRGPVPTTTIGEIHRWVSSTAFFGLAVVGALACRRFEDGRRRLLAILTALTVVGLVLVTATSMFQDFANGGQWRGLPQRGLLLLETGTMLVLAGASASASRRETRCVATSRSLSGGDPRP